MIHAPARPAMQRVADEVLDVVRYAYAADLLAQWEGFGRFCRDVLGVEPLVLAVAFGRHGDDPAAEVRASPDAVASEAKFARWAEQWSSTWKRRFGA